MHIFGLQKTFDFWIPCFRAGIRKITHEARNDSCSSLVSQRVPKLSISIANCGVFILCTSAPKFKSKSPWKVPFPGKANVFHHFFRGELLNFGGVNLNFQKAESSPGQEADWRRDKNIRCLVVTLVKNWILAASLWQKKFRVQCVSEKKMTSWVEKALVFVEFTFKNRGYVAPFRRDRPILVPIMTVRSWDVMTEWPNRWLGTSWFRQAVSLTGGKGLQK